MLVLVMTPSIGLTKGQLGHVPQGPSSRGPRLNLKCQKRNYCKQMLLKIINNFQSDTV